MRDNLWLEEKLEELWEENFSDVPRQNKVTVKFGKRAYRTLGSIKYIGKLSPKDPEFKIHDDKRISQITLTRHYMDEKIPEEVVLGTIAHEMCHYAHGFNSPLKQQFEHPHRGQVIKKEMYKRELGGLYETSEGWIKKNWRAYLQATGNLKLRRRRRSRIRFF